MLNIIQNDFETANTTYLDNRGECFIRQQGVPWNCHKGMRTGTEAG